MSLPQIQLSPEEIQKRLGYFNVGDDHIAQLFAAETPPQVKRQLLQQMIDGAAKYALQSSQVLMDEHVRKIREDYDPFKNVSQEMYRDRMYDQFYKQFPALKEYDKVVQDAVTALAGAADMPQDMPGMFNRLSQEALSRVKQFKPDFALVPVDAGTQQQNGGGAQSPAPATVTPASTDAGGYQGGTAGTPKAAPKTGQADALWED